MYHQLFLGDRESNGKYTFQAHIDGVYTFCLGNKMSTMTPKVVMFNIDKGAPPATINDGGDENEEHSKLGSFFVIERRHRGNPWERRQRDNLIK